jgi:hypothetical protein
MDNKELFKCQFGKFENIGDSLSFRILVTADAVVLAFQGSYEKRDWINNFYFIAKPYRKMPKLWFCHSGFARAWDSGKDYITERVKNYILENGNKKFIITGYSHGAAIATLAHEWFVFNGFHPKTVVFGCPRVLWMPAKWMEERFVGYTSIGTRGDIVTHVPPALFGFRHIFKVQRIGEQKMISHLPHYPDNYLNNL